MDKASSPFTDSQDRPLGAHLSVGKGLEHTLQTAAKLDATALQLFTANQRQWHPSEKSEAEKAWFRQNLPNTQLRFCCSHASYLINLCSPDTEMAAKSARALIQELRRSDDLNIDWVVVHPGARKDLTTEAAHDLLCKQIDHILAETADLKTSLLIENTAGQGTTVGASMTELATVLNCLNWPDRLGICLDTCHCFAAGYDLRRQQVISQLVSELSEILSHHKLKCFHLNDSLHSCGSNKDRHWHIGEGEIGPQGFRNLLSTEQFKHVPGIIETPKPKTDEAAMEKDRENLKRLREYNR
jgi:deoxyribonuclease-4